MTNNQCFFCGGHMEEKLTTFVYEEGGHVSVVRDVPAWVCKQCGEREYAEQTTHRLLRLLKHPPRPSEITHVPTYEWAGAGAQLDVQT